MVIEIAAQKETGDNKSTNHAAGMSQPMFLFDATPPTHQQKSAKRIEESVERWKGVESHKSGYGLQR